MNIYKIIQNRIALKKVDPKELSNKLEEAIKKLNLKDIVAKDFVLVKVTKDYEKGIPKYHFQHKETKDKLFLSGDEIEVPIEDEDELRGKFLSEHDKKILQPESRFKEKISPELFDEIGNSLEKSIPNTKREGGNIYLSDIDVYLHNDGNELTFMILDNNKIWIFVTVDPKGKTI